MSAIPELQTIDAQLLAVISRHWGYNTFRPLQRDAIHAVMSGRDSIVVLPTGGGKSLCYQAPALLLDGVTVVVSPLISLMKDQVDGLLASGVRAAQLNSSLDAIDQRAIERDLLDGRIDLLFVSPERLAIPAFRRLLSEAKVAAFAIDEAHCISHWGHDFRQEYRMLRDLRRDFPDAALHAYTATATARVRDDIVSQLALRDPVALLGSFDRPNLTYRAVPRRDEMRQIEEILSRHKGEAGIIYCIRRRDVDEITAALKRRGHNAMAYHAGLPIAERKHAQEAFAEERCDIVVATVAFGMGIDRSNVRFVLHAAMPKSIEHYQQESGRAGRDGLEAECVLLWSASDVVSWMNILESGSAEGGISPAQLEAARRQLREIEAYCSRSVCRHRSLVEYFGEPFTRENCGACDVCLGDFDDVDDAQTIAQKILSCVVRQREPYGVNHLVSVLRGENLEKIRSRGHDNISTFGILAAHSKEELRDWIGQLVGMRVLEIEHGKYPVVHLSQASREVLRGERAVSLRAPRAGALRLSASDESAWSGVDRGLFEELRNWRRRRAERAGVAPFVIFSDATLRQLAAIRPSTIEQMRQVYGMGDTKLREFGADVMRLVLTYAGEHDLDLDQRVAQPEHAWPTDGRVSVQKQTAFDVFARGGSIEEAATQSGRALSTTGDYLAEWITRTRPESVSAWVADTAHAEIAAAIAEIGAETLRALREHLGERYSYNDIRIVVAHVRGRSGQTVL